MVYIFINKETNKITPYGSIQALSGHENIKKDNLYTHFGRKGNTQFENDKYIIAKAEIIRSSKPTE
jgi:hypothetical protein